MITVLIELICDPKINARDSLITVNRSQCFENISLCLQACRKKGIDKREKKRYNNNKGWKSHAVIIKHQLEASDVNDIWHRTRSLGFSFASTVQSVNQYFTSVGSWSWANKRLLPTSFVQHHRPINSLLLSNILISLGQTFLKQDVFRLRNVYISSVSMSDLQFCRFTSQSLRLKRFSALHKIDYRFFFWTFSMNRDVLISCTHSFASNIDCDFFAVSDWNCANASKHCTLFTHSIRFFFLFQLYIYRMIG